MKTMRFHSIIFLALTAAVLAGCAKEIPEQEAPVQVGGSQAATTVQFTATLAPRGESVTKALGADGTTTWAVDEEIAVYYLTSKSYATTTATVSSVDGTGKATINATLTDARNNGVIRFVYPASLHKGKGAINESALLTQNGTLAGISTNLDAATGSGTMVVENGNATTNGSITMTNQLLIGKFSPKYGSNVISGITRLTINDGTRTYTVSPSSGTFGTDGIYVAMLPVTQQEVILMAETDSQNYGFSGKTITLEQGKFYTNLAIPMLKAYDLSAGNVSTSEDAYIYQSNSSPTNHTATIASDTKAILSSVNVNADNQAAVVCEGDATITLTGNNTVITSASYYPAVQVSNNLWINGLGSLTATGGSYAPGIGNKHTDSCDNIYIEAGNITATGGIYAPGIGSCYAYSSSVSCGDITISGGSVTARGGDRAPGIGAGNGSASDSYTSTCGAVTIEDGAELIVAINGNNAPGPIGSAASYSTCGTVNIDGVENPTASSSFYSFYLFVTTTTNTDDTWTLNHDGNVSGTVSNAITIPNGGSLTLSGMSLNVSSGPAITCLGNATIVVTGENTVTSSADGCPAIQAGPEDYTLTIQGDGVLTATGASGAAGIGAAKNGECGNITVSLGDSGVLNANGGANGAGIGSGYAASSNSSCGNITLHSGNIYAKGGEGAAGIGSGVSTASYFSLCGAITIDLVISVKAIMGSGANAPIGLGSGNDGIMGIKMHENIAKTVSTTTTTNDTWTLTQQASVSGDPGNSGNGGTTVGSGSVSGEINETITIQNGSTVIFSNMTNNTSEGPAIECSGNATIIFVGSNTFSTSAEGYPAIKAGPPGTTLTIQGSGSLTATGGYGGAGIGSGSNGTCGNITISEGTVRATGGDSGAGIGSGSNGTCGAITISGGTVTATGGNYAAGIGSGHTGTSSNIIIGSNITRIIATMGSGALAPIGKGFEGRGNGTVTIDETTEWLAGTSTTHLSWVISSISDGDVDTDDTDNTWTLKPKLLSGSYSSTISLLDGDECILSNVTINASNGPAILCEGNATITLVGNNKLSVSKAIPAIQAGPSGTTLTIQGTGSLEATGGGYAAGIGSGSNSTCGNITISGGTVTANGGDSAAGIGSGSGNGSKSTCGSITISGGTVEATGGGNGSGIGSGSNGTCGNITISGGTVTAMGKGDAAGIGGGFRGTCGAITISEGTVTATGAANSAGIGGGRSGTCGSITISGGTVEATGGHKGSGIGSGSYKNTCGAITISGGTVTAKAGPLAAGAGIGSGYNGIFSSITIGSGITSVTATSGDGAPTPIGKGGNDQGSGTVTIDGVVNPSADASLPNLNRSVTNGGRTWTLTPKSQN